MNGTFTIHSGPFFGVPLVEHVVVVAGESTSEVEWRWELLRHELYTAFPHLEKTSAYISANGFDGVNGNPVLNILILIECDQDVLRDICSRCGGYYIDNVQEGSQ